MVLRSVALGAVGAGAAAGPDVVDLVVTGDLPIGDTTADVTYFIVDTISNSLVGQVILPNASRKTMSVALIVKVAKANGSYSIGTFETDGGFRAAEFLSLQYAR